MASEKNENASDSLARRGAVLLVGGGIVQAIIGFLAQIILLRHLLPEDIGQFIIALASASLIQSIISLRINVLIIRARESDLLAGDGERYRCCIFWEVIVAGIVTIIWFWLAGLLNIWTLVLLFTLLLAHWGDHNKAFYERKMPYARLATIETTTQVAGHGVAVMLIFAGAGVAALYIREAFTVISRTIVLALVGALPAIKARWLKIKEWQALFREAGPIWVDGLGEGVFNRLVLIVVTGLTGLRGVGLFSQAHRLAVVPNQIVAPFVSRVLVNWLSRLTTDLKRKRMLLIVLSMLGVTLTIAAVLAVLFADPVVPFLFGPAWADSAGVLAAMAGVIVFMSLFETMRTFCLSQRRTQTLLKGRALLFVVFFGGVGGLMLLESVNVINLAAVLSVAVAASFLAMLPAVFQSGRK